MISFEPITSNVKSRIIADFQRNRDDACRGIDLLSVDPMERLHALPRIAGAGVDILRVALIDVVKADSDRPVCAGLKCSVFDMNAKVTK